MSYVGLIFLGLAVLFAAAAWSAIWARRDTPGRAFALVLFVVALPVLAASAIESLGWAKPLWAAHELTGEYRVIGSKMVAGEAIFVYVDLGRSEPRSIRIPWNPGLASTLQGILNDPKNKGSAVMRFEWSWDKNAVQFHPLPQPRVLPPKRPEPDPPRYERGA